MEKEKEPLLMKINSPEDLKCLDEGQLPILAHEIRDFIIDEVSKNPGHFGASLGVVEITLAIHYVFNSPYDKIVWDVGHQAYTHKIITGRRDRFHLNRKLNGISGFPKMSESKHDAFGVGHSSTSISAALGMAMASKLMGDDLRQHIAIIGDGSMTGGMAMEALNNAGVENANLLIILNDNGIAIDKNVGAIKEALAHMTASRAYNKFKNWVWRVMGGNSPRYGKNSRAVVKQVSNAFKSSILDKSNFFQDFNIRYFGPIDGHDVLSLIKILKDLKTIPGPKILHCITKKGKGYVLAEKEQVKFHAPGFFDKFTGESLSQKSDVATPPNYQQVFGETILELAEKNANIVGITPAMPSGCSLNIMMEKMPDRTFDVGIAEQHAVTLSAGMAVRGLMPFCNIYSSFMQRAYDQVVHDVALQNLDVVFCLDRAGLVGEDGATHHGTYDLAFFRCVPNITICAPLNEVELRNMMYTAQLGGKGAFVIRYPRGKGVLLDWKQPFEEVSVGKGVQLRSGSDIAIITIGHPGNAAMAAADILAKQSIEAAVYNLRFLKPIDEELLHEVFASHKNIVTVEDGTVVGGMGAAILEFMNAHNYSARVEVLGVPDVIIEQGTIEQLQRICGYDTQGILDAVHRLLK